MARRPVLVISAGVCRDQADTIVSGVAAWITIPLQSASARIDHPGAIPTWASKYTSSQPAGVLLNLSWMLLSKVRSKRKVDSRLQGPLTPVSSQPMLNTSSSNRDAISSITCRLLMRMVFDGLLACNF